ncbi:hypothetical protein B4923_18735 [Brenneria roseae subsp. americana]|uniref:6-phosphofructokinase n=1 Tax=Brenneria roseae subsp. americana TaxID=1508507 RepID=A0A2U1TK21_9GAMM|nr:ATP-dependent 6-phosphofructokinase [Brenneria roseae]PWC09753.1 hypothetical protein B4923_18735 [Brenneria roseae subsp. americana]
MKRIAMIASGGDAVGINAAILMLIQHKGLSALAFHGGYDGIVEQSFFELSEREVRSVLASGNNLLRSARSRLAWNAEGRQAIRQRLRELEVDVLVVFGGGGSLKAARLLDEEGMPTLVLPMTIDNDIGATDYTLGHASALSVVTQALDQLHGTAHNMPGRIYMLEVFGADAGHIALSGALAGGAHAVILPECPLDTHWLTARLRDCIGQPFGYAVVVCAEGYPLENAYVAGTQGVSITLGKTLESSLGVPVRHTILGYCQRAATPSVQDRLAATALGQLALEAILADRHGLLFGFQGTAMAIDLRQVATSKRELDPQLVVAARNLNMIN